MQTNGGRAACTEKRLANSESAEIMKAKKSLSSDITAVSKLNEFRKQFTPSERKAIGEAIEAELGDRHGGDRRSSAAIAALETTTEGRTIDLAAKRAGFKSAARTREVPGVDRARVRVDLQERRTIYARLGAVHIRQFV